MFNENLKRLGIQAALILIGIAIGFVGSESRSFQVATERSLTPSTSKKDRFIPVSGPFILHRKGYSLCFNGATRNPIWTYEKLTKGSISGSSKRSNDFREDPDIPSHLGSTPSDYRHSNFDRGHLTPTADFKNDQQAMNETFFMTNISPQVPSFNRGPWKSLEERIRKIVDRSLSVSVVTGPLFLPENGIVSYRVIGEGSVAVPTHFFKVIIIEESKGVFTREAYVLPNSELAGNTPLDDYKVSVRRIEEVAGLVFNL